MFFRATTKNASTTEFFSWIRNSDPGFFKIKWTRKGYSKLVITNETYKMSHIKWAMSNES